MYIYIHIYSFCDKPMKTQLLSTWICSVIVALWGTMSSRGHVQVHFFVIPSSLILGVCELVHCTRLFFPVGLKLVSARLHSPTSPNEIDGMGGGDVISHSIFYTGRHGDPACTSLFPIAALPISPGALEWIPARSAARMVYGFVNMAVR